MATGLVAACVPGEVQQLSPEVDPAGWVQLGLTVNPGMEIQQVSYRITAPALGMSPRQGTIDVAMAGTQVSAVLGGLPAGDGYRIDLLTTTVGGNFTCSGDASFAVAAGRTTPVVVQFDCRTSEGIVRIDLAVNNCPTINGLIVTPRSADGSIAVAAAIAEPDPGDIPRYDWSATSGQYRDPRSSATAFVCPTGPGTGPGPIQGTVRVSDGQCAAEARFDLACGGPTVSSPAPATPTVSQAALTVAPGTEIHDIAYRITGSGIAPREGNVDVRGSSGSAMFSLPSGAGYYLTMAGSSTDGQTTCQGQRAFEIGAGQMARVPVALQCRRPPATGGLAVQGRFNLCPAGRILVVNSIQGTFWLSAAVSDAESSPLTLQWTADRGRFSAAGSHSPFFYCSGAGTVLVRLAVSDGSCETVVYQELGC